jgi:hypothetical protein
MPIDGRKANLSKGIMELLANIIFCAPLVVDREIDSGDVDPGDLITEVIGGLDSAFESGL